MARVEYFDLTIPAPRRIAMMRADFAGHAARYPHCPAPMVPKTWRDVRHWGLHNWEAAFCALSPGRDSGGPVWYSHQGPEFRGERDASPEWYTDVHQDETAIGIVARLTRGRYIAGYRWTSNDERVYFPDVFDDENDAENMASEHARVFAENARDDSERFDAMQSAEYATDQAAENFRDVWALRHTGRRDNDDAREALQALRDAREALDDATRNYERG